MNDSVSRASQFFDAAYQQQAPWDIGAAQPAFIALLNEFPPTGRVLDIGCGSGDLAIDVAKRGLDVLGIDSAPTAIVRAQAKADADAEIKSRVEFRVGDALHPSQFGQFGAIVDSGFYHIFEQSERDRLAQEIAMALEKGGRYYLLGFGIQSPFPNAPRQVTESEIAARFAPEKGWRIVALRRAHFATRSPRGDIPAIAACIERVV